MSNRHFVLEDDFEGIIRRARKNVVAIEKIPTGWTNYVYKAAVANGTSYIFRFPRHDFWVESLKKEIWFNKFIRDKVSVKTADLKYKNFGGRHYSVHKYMNGLTFTEAYPFMNDAQKRALAEDIVTYLQELQKVDISGVKLPLNSEFNIGLAQVNGDPHYDYMTMFKPFFEKEKKGLVLAHGDFNMGNIVLNKKFKMIAVLDYAFASRSAGPADISVLLVRTPAEFRPLMISAYEKRVGKKMDIGVLDGFIAARAAIEQDYVNYMARCHKDVILPDLK